jgi:hypothetical protein
MATGPRELTLSTFQRWRAAPRAATRKVGRMTVRNTSSMRLIKVYRCCIGAARAEGIGTIIPVKYFKL